jgi:hypothetical protein
MFENVSEPTGKEKTYRCPCCKYKTLHGRGGFEMCPVCWWEDEGQGEHNVDQVRGGPNGTLSLRQAQDNFKIFGASEERLIGNARKPLPDEF